jgi:peptidoglycan hydrolase-like protein with peptidoglycan-binding domain/lysozyme family protein
MPSQSRRTSQKPPAAESSEESVNWETKVCSAVSNADIISIVSGQTVDEDTASSMLSSAESEVAGNEAQVAGNEAAPAKEEAPRRVIPDGITGEAFVDHDDRVRDLKLRGGMDWNLKFFKTTWEANQARYQNVSAQTGVPAILIAAIHFRESGMDFTKYLHQGDPLGKKAVHVPKNIPIFHDWDKAAVHALNMKRGIRTGVGMESDTTDLAAMATYAEAYNGFGYRKYHNSQSAYVYAGTNQYSGGRYVKDGKFDKNSWDQRPGVMALVHSVGGGEVSDAPLSEQTADDAWQQVLTGNEVLRLGQRRPAVRALQTRLDAAGYDVGIDGDFGPRTRSAVIRFQTDNGITIDGVVGKGTAEAVEKGKAAPPAAAVDCEPELQTEAEVVTPEVKPSTPETTVPSEVSLSAAWNSVKSGRLLLKRGDRGDAVRDLQKLLAKAGHDVVIDGLFGRETRRVVRAFQSALGLAVDGIVGRDTASGL